MAEKPWVDAIRRLLQARLRPDPRRAGGKPKYWNQSDLSEAASVPGTTVSAIVNGRLPDMKTLVKLAEALEVPLWEFFVDDDQAEMLEKHRTAKVIASKEAELEARIERRMVEKFAAIAKAARTEIEAEMTAEATGQSAGHPDNDLPTPRPVARKKRA